MTIYSIAITIAFFALLVLYYVNDNFYKTVLRLIVLEKKEDSIFRLNLVKQLSPLISNPPEKYSKSEEIVSSVMNDVLKHSLGKLESRGMMFLKDNSSLKSKIRIFIKGDPVE